MIDPVAATRSTFIVKKLFDARVANATFCSARPSTQYVVHAEEIDAWHSGDQDYNGPDRNVSRDVVRGRRGKILER